MLFLLITAVSGDLAPWQIYVGVTISSIFVALQNPAYKAAITDLVPPEQYARAGALVQLASSAQHLLAPMLAGLLLSVGGVAVVLILDLSTFVVAVAAALAIGRPLVASRPGARDTAQDPPRCSLRGELAQGWNTVRHRAGVFAIVVLMSVTTFFVGMLQTLFAPMLLSFTDARTLGFVQSFAASGMMIGSLVLGAVGISRRHEAILVLALTLAGAFVAAVGLTTKVAIITGSLFLFFCTLPLINTCAEVLIRTRIPNELQGRAWGIIGLLSQLGFVAAYGISGLLADRLFAPLLTEGGVLADSVGRIVGTGEGRGIALMLVLSGAGLVAAAVRSVRPLVSGGLQPPDGIQGHDDTHVYAPEAVQP